MSRQLNLWVGEGFQHRCDAAAAVVGLTRADFCRLAIAKEVDRVLQETQPDLAALQAQVQALKDQLKAAGLPLLAL
jgi:hypothetical protein